MSYAKIGPDDGSYGAWKEISKMEGRFFCNAVNHSARGGCPNPACWLHRPGATDKREGKK